jgi:hypothetical protein
MSKENPLFVEHLENVSWRVLEEYPNLIKQMIRKRAGIYVLYRRDKLYYVGLARNLMGRLKSHIKDRHRGYWDQFSVYLTVHDEHMKELESLLLKITKPRGNKAGGKFAKSVNLLFKLYRDMKDNDADKHARLLGGSIAQRRMQVRTRRDSNMVPLAGIVGHSVRLKAIYKQKRYLATLRKDGKISFQKKLYDSPNEAAFVACGKHVNGWRFWLYRDKGNWISIG